MEIVIASLRTADRKIEKHKPDAVISIGKPGGTHHCTKPYGVHWLSLDMWDTTPARNRRPLPGWYDVTQISTFANLIKVAFQSPLLLCHCQMGRSRSTAAAVISLVATGYSETEAIEKLLAAAPKSTPNGWMLALGDMLMDTRMYCVAESYGIVKWHRKTKNQIDESFRKLGSHDR